MLHLPFVMALALPVYLVRLCAYGLTECRCAGCSGSCLWECAHIWVSAILHLASG